MYNVEDLLELVKLISVWRTSECSFRVYPDDEGEYCDGENHRLDCATEIAMADILAIHNKLTR